MPTIHTWNTVLTFINEKKYMNMNDKNLFVFISWKHTPILSVKLSNTNKDRFVNIISRFRWQYSVDHRCLFITFRGQITIKLAWLSIK
jgi:hypothetical protein